MWSVFNRLRAFRRHGLPAPPARATQHARSGQVRPHQSGPECGGGRPRQRTRGVYHRHTAVGALRAEAGPVFQLLRQMEPPAFSVTLSGYKITTPIDLEDLDAKEEIRFDYSFPHCYWLR